MERKKNLETRAKLLSRKLNRLPNLKLRIESPRYASIQGLFSRGDRRMASLLTKAAESGLKASLMRDPEADPERTLYSERAGDELFPWDVTGHGIGKSVLYKRYLAAMNRRLD
jgi:hypothetical protein